MLLEAMLETAQQRRERPAVADPQIQWNYGQLLWAAATLRDVIAANSRSDNVGILLPASAAFAAAFYGCLWARRAAVPLNFLLAGPELRRIVADADLDLVVSVRPLAEQAEAGGVKTLYLDQIGLKARAIWRRLRGLPKAPAFAADDVAAILYTSGTSGEPKGVCLTHNNLLTDARACWEHIQIDVNQRFLGVLPPFHSFGLTATVLLPLTLGASAYYLPRFQPAQIVRTIAQQRISILMAIPSMYGAIARLKDIEPDAFKTLYLAISGGEPLPTAVFADCRDALGITIYEGYGLTETSPVVSINIPAQHKIGSVGKPIPGVQVRIVDESGADLPAGSVGEVLIRGPIVMKGYYKKPELTRAILDASGWLWTGDMGSLDEQGFLTITGRKKEMMIIGGENVFPAEIERILESHRDVAEAAVIGIHDDRRGQVPVAFVIPHEAAQVSEIELRHFCRERLAPYKVPREIRFTDTLPRSPTGKVLKRRLQEELAQG